MKDLITTIDEIIKYGLQSNIIESNKEKELEKNLVKLYYLYFDINYEFDENEYLEFDIQKFSNIKDNLKTNFGNFGFYKTILDINDIDNIEDSALGDATDDLLDIIKDLLEIKWRIDNNSLADGLWYFEFIFKTHTQQHILDLLNYLKQKNG
jgi:hypothetical protein